MNVNLTSATESSKITKGVTDKTTVSDEATEAEGFFAKLTAMLKGESKSELKSVDSASGKAAEQVSSEDAEVLEGGKAQSTDALLSGADAELEGEASEVEASSELTAKESQESAVAVPKELEKFIENSDELESSSQQVKQTVAESEALLGRLEQANKTLQAKDGNSLPPQDADLASETAALDGKSSLSDDVMVAQTTHSTDGEALQAVAAQAPTSEQPINAESLPNQTANGVQTEQTNSAELASSEQAPTISEAELAAAHASQVNVVSGAKTTSQDTDELGLASPETEQQGEPTVSGDGEVIAPAIAWSSNGAVATDDISKQMVETDLLHKQTHKPVTNAAQLQAGVAATVTNGATNSQVANPAVSGTPTGALTPATPMDLSAAAQLQLMLRQR
ncbi:flagellar hook-length control protein FliK [Vibrio ponticus]|nr:flagellar hook-length control protein FliK [Vibrio ponticus]